MGVRGGRALSRDGRSARGATGGRSEGRPGRGPGGPRVPRGPRGSTRWPAWPAPGLEWLGAESWRGPGVRGQGTGPDQPPLAAQGAGPSFHRVRAGRPLGRERPLDRDRRLVRDGRRGIPGQRQLDATQQTPAGRAPEAVVADLMDAGRQDVLQEAPDELVGLQRQGLPAGLAGGLVAERDPAALDGLESMVSMTLTKRGDAAAGRPGLTGPLRAAPSRPLADITPEGIRMFWS